MQRNGVFCYSSNYKRSFLQLSFIYLIYLSIFNSILPESLAQAGTKLVQSKESRSRFPATSERIPKRYKRASLTKLRSVPICFKTDRDSLSLFKSSKRLREKLSSVQRDEFHEEMQSLQPGRASHSTEEHTRAKAVNKTSALSQLDPFVDDDRLLRIGGRLKRADMSHAAKHPVILPRKGPVTNLIIAHCRQAVENQVRGITHNRMRLSGYLIVGGASAVSNHI